MICCADITAAPFLLCLLLHQGLGSLDGAGTGAIMDYGSLIWVTLQRAKTSEEAITIMDQLTQTYGW